MGRVNFGSTVHDRKGITEKVELIKPDKQAVTLKNRKVYSIPVDYKFAARKKYSSNSLRRSFQIEYDDFILSFLQPASRQEQRLLGTDFPKTA